MSNDSASPPVEPVKMGWRPWQFSLGALSLLVLVVVLLFAYLRHLDAYYTSTAATRTRLEQVGGHTLTKPVALGRAAWLFGHDEWQETVNLTFAPVHAALQDGNHATFNPELDDASLLLVCEFSQLKHLTLSETRNVTGAGLRCLANLSTLETLSLDSLQLTSADLEFISSLSGLQELNLDRVNLADDALRQLAGLRNLKRLSLGGNPLQGSGLAQLENLSQLESLGLDYTKVADEHLRWVARLPALQFLNLSGTPVSDAGLRHLEPLKNLRKLWLSQTKISQAAKEEFARSHPGCDLGLDPKTDPSP